MKKRLLIILVTIVLVVFTTPPLSATSGAPPATAGSAGTQVTAKAEPVYVFAAPTSGVTITYPQTQAVLGNFVVGNLFLESGEWLTVKVLPESMVHMGNPAVTLPYQVSFLPPPALSADNIGENYATMVVIAPDVLENAPAGTYHAVLRFRVTSHPDRVVVWEGITTVIVRVNNREQSTPSGKPTYSSEATSSQVATSSSPTVPSRASTPSKASLSSVVTIESEPTPGETPEMGAIVMRYGLVFVALALLTLILLTLVIGKRKKSD